MDLMVFRNSQVASTKIFSVSDMGFPLERKSLTCRKQEPVISVKPSAYLKWVGGIHLVGQKLVEVTQLVGVGDFSVQRGAQLL